MNYENLIKEIINKKEWTGIDLGKLCLISLIYKTQKTPFYMSQSYIDNMAQSLEGDVLYTGQFLHLGLLTNFLNDEHYKLNIHIHRFLHGYFRLTEQIRLFFAYQNKIKSMNKLPLVLDPGKFDAYKRRALELLGGEPLSISDLIIKSLEIAIKEKIKLQEQAPALADALNYVQAQECANNRFLELYKRVYKHGSYFLKDGLKFVYKTDMKNIAIRGKLLFKGIKAIRKKAKEYDLTDYSDQDIIDALEKKPITKELEFIINDLIIREGHKVTWLNDEGAPGGLDVNKLLLFYIDEYKKNKERAISYLKADFAELYQALLTHVCNAIGAPGDDLFTNVTNKKEVAQTQIIGADLYMRMSDADAFKILYDNEPSERFYRMSQRAKSGIIITQDDMAESYESYFREAHITPGIEDIFTSQDDPTKNDEVYNVLIETPLYELFRYRAFLEVVEKEFQIPGLFDSLANNVTPLIDTAEKFNNFLYSFYLSVYGDKNTVASTRKLIKERFKPINTKQYIIKKSVIKRAINKYDVFMNSYQDLNRFPESFYSFFLEV